MILKIDDVIAPDDYWWVDYRTYSIQIQKKIEFEKDMPFIFLIEFNNFIAWILILRNARTRIADA